MDIMGTMDVSVMYEGRKMDRMGTMAVSVMYEGRKMARVGTMDVSVIYECMREEDGQGGNDGCECHV